ncbi:MAG TPA: PLP-dependent aminotransferase family protein [Thermoanaerobaculia bacterium]
MRRSRGILLPPIASRTIHGRDVYRAIRGAILDGTFSPGDRLPSSRETAKDYGVSRGMIDEVFAQLADEGFIERGIGKGTFVSASVGRLQASPKNSVSSHAISRRGAWLSSNAACREPEKLRPFNAGVADTRDFPWRIWHRLQSRAARELGPGALDFADPRGLTDLRAAIARYLAQFRGIRCTADEVIIFNSAQQALYAIALLLLEPRDPVLLETPVYLGARAAFELAGAKSIPIAVDDDGMRVDRIRRGRMAYVTPSHQYPTGAMLSLDRRVALLDWAVRNDAWILEDDYDGEFRYEGQPLTPVYSLDRNARVLYVGTLSKAMFVSLRIAYAVVPRDLIEPLANIRTQLDGFTPALSQMTMTLFMEEGHFASHLRRMRGVYAAKHRMLVDGLAPLAKRGWTWPDNPAGMHLLIRHASAAKARAIAQKSGLDLALLSSYRLRHESGDGLLLRFGGLDEAAIRLGIAKMLTFPRA